MINDADIIEAIDQGSCTVTDWEAEFLETLVRYGPSPSLSPKQRAVLTRMAEKYLPLWMVAEWLGQQRLAFMAGTVPA